MHIGNFCDSELDTENAAEKIKIDRAHRIGRYERGKRRPIVAKFNYYGDKVNVKDRAREHLTGTSFRVADQLPKVVQERRKKLIPYFVHARNNGKEVSLSHDALYIDHVKYTHDNLPPGPVPDLPPRVVRNRPTDETEESDMS